MNPDPFAPAITAEILAIKEGYVRFAITRGKKKREIHSAPAGEFYKEFPIELPQ